jgi:WD40 repeat protein
LTGSYRQEEVLELWDLRTFKKSRVIGWDGPKASDKFTDGMELDKTNDEENKENASPRQTSPSRSGSPGKEPPTEIEGFSRQSPAPFIYSTCFSNKYDVIMAAGAGANEVRLFDYKTGNILCCIGDMNRAVLSMTKANTTSDFAFGSADSRLRIMQQRNIK